MSCSPSDYNDFIRRWNQYKKDTGLPSDQINGQLVGCFSAELESNFASANFDVSKMKEADILAEVKGFAVAQIAIGTRRAEVMTAKQQHGELFRIFVCRVRKLATDCEFVMKCSSGVGKCRYAEEIIKNVVLAGIYDQEIKRLVLLADEMHDKDIQEIIKTVELHERAFSMTATGGSATVAATTAYKAKGRSQQQPSQLSDSGGGGGGGAPARGEV